MRNRQRPPLHLTNKADAGAAPYCCCILVSWGAVAENLIVADGVTVLAAAVAGIALHSVDDAILHAVHDAHMVAAAVLPVAVPIKEDDVAGARLITNQQIEPQNRMHRAFET